MKSSEIRSRFFDFFTKNGHEKVASSSLIPAQDPSLLFANAGMNQFKDIFLGLEKRSYARAVSIQKCVRAGGKHNDLDNVGFTKRHLTFFEMMGNFSFGDYFKKEAIQYAWDFLTKELKLSTETLHASVYKTDDESFDLWHTMIGLPKSKIHRLGKKDNFWSMGAVGPCGPCSEIFIDRGPEFGCKDATTCGPACECDRFLEIWNLVFMQFDCQEDGSLKELKQKGVDTGMGLERLCVIVQEKDSIFGIDLFQNIIKKIEELTGLNYEKQPDKLKAAFHVLADHIRSAALLIADSCAPSNDGRGYVLRKIIRRAALFAQKLTDNQKLFAQLSRVVVRDMGEYYPELVTNQELIEKILTSEIKKFATNLIRGKSILEQYFKESAEKKVITGRQAFKLYDTYGFPIELIVIMAHERNYSVDGKGFEKMMEKQQAQSGKKTADPLDHFELDASIKTEFTGYQELETTSEISALIADDKITQFVPAGKTCWIIARKSPYFIVGGGQVPDEGWIVLGEHKTKLLKVRYINGRIAAHIKAPIDIKIGDAVTSIVDEQWRTNAMKNHTGTHLLQAALISLFGKQIKQSGSLVHPDYLRFDFTYHENLSPDDIKKVEDLVNEKIRQNIPVRIEYTTMRDAVKHGALAFFGDKYNPEKVRMVDVDGFSVELCGGTHVPETGVIGAFKITEVTALSAGHRRIVAVTGPRAIELFQETFNTVKTLGQNFKVKREEVLQTVLKQKEQIKVLQQNIKTLQKQIWRAQLPIWEKQVASVNKIPFLFLALQNYTNENMREIADTLAQKKPGFYFLISTTNNSSQFFVLLSAHYATSLNLKKFAGWLKDDHNFRGGLTKNMIRGGGGKFDAKLEGAIKQWVKNNQQG